MDELTTYLLRSDATGYAFKKSLMRLSLALPIPEISLPLKSVNPKAALNLAAMAKNWSAGGNIFGSTAICLIEAGADLETLAKTGVGIKKWIYSIEDSNPHAPANLVNLKELCRKDPDFALYLEKLQAEREAAKFTSSPDMIGGETDSYDIEI